MRSRIQLISTKLVFSTNKTGNGEIARSNRNFILRMRTHECCSLRTVRLQQKAALLFN